MFECRRGFLFAICSETAEQLAGEASARRGQAEREQNVTIA